MNEKSIYRLKIAVGVIGVLAFAAIIIWFMIGLGRTRDASDEQRLLNVKQSVVNGAVLCYSVEGFYPDGLAYLKENYGLTYDEDRYLVHYGYISADIRPTVMVYEKEQ